MAISSQLESKAVKRRNNLTSIKNPGTLGSGIFYARGLRRLRGSMRSRGWEFRLPMLGFSQISKV